MAESLLSLLRKMGLGKLRTLAGETIIAAVEKVAPANMEREVAEILLLKYGEDILGVRDIRLGIVDVMDDASSRKLVRAIGKTASSHLEANKILREHFHSYGEKKSRVLVDQLGLSPAHYHKSPVENRSETELIAIESGEKVPLGSYLHPYQKAIKDEIIDLLNVRGRRFLIQMPTGSGKTFTALEAVVDILRRRRRRRYIVWIVDSNELAEQALNAFTYLWKLKGDRPIYAFRLFGGFASAFHNDEGGVVFAGFAQFHSILSNSDHASYQALWRLINNTELLIVDEAHTSVAPTYEACIRAFLNNDYTSVVGLSATPGRSDPESLKELIALYSDTLVRLTDPAGKPIKDPVGYLQNQSILSRLDCKILETGVTLTEAEEASLLASLAANSERNDRILKQIQLATEAEESTLVFACTVDHVLALSILCKARGIKAEYIIGAVEQPRRLDILARFKARDFFILLNLDILSTGIDVPKVNRLIVTRPVGTPILYSQIIGRALRGPKNGGNPINTVITLKDNLANYPSANFVYNMFALDWRAEVL